MKPAVVRTAIVVVALLSSVAIGVAQDGKDIFKDKNGYFGALRPKGWRQQDYPEETIRSKVAFHHPQINGVNIRIIAGPTPTESYSLDDLLTENQQKIATIFKPKFPFGSFTVRKEKVGDREGVVQINSAQGAIEQKIVMFVNKNIWYSIACNANSKADYDKASTAYETFLSSFTILEGGKQFTDAEVKAGLVAKYRRVAKLYVEMGQKAEALNWVNQGLDVDSNDADLKQLKEQITTSAVK